MTTGPHQRRSGRPDFPGEGVPSSNKPSSPFRNQKATRGFFGASSLPRRWAPPGGGSWSPSPIKTVLGLTLALYLLNQRGWLPSPLSAVVSKALFWPTLPLTVVRRVGKWTTVVDDAVVMGGAPFGFAGLPETLYHEYGVRTVINMCDEYEGPLRQYEGLGVKQLRIPTLDHHCPSVEALEAAVEFVQRATERDPGHKVYVHCRAGHGRSAAAVFCWLLHRNPTADRKTLNEQFRRKRFVKDTLWKEPAIVEFHERLLQRLRQPTSDADNANDPDDDAN